MTRQEEIKTLEHMNTEKCKYCGHKLYYRATSKNKFICKYWNCEAYWKLGYVRGRPE